MRLRTAIGACLIALLGVGVAVAHDDDSHSKKKHHHGHGKHKAEKHQKLKDRDRKITQEWCREHRHNLPAGFREIDRLPPQLDVRIQVGVVLDAELRPHVHPVPFDLRHQLPVPPSGVKYVAIGGHIALIDRAHQLHDLLPRPPLPF